MGSERSNPAGEAEIDARVAALMGHVQDADFERFDPPQDLWGRIASSIAQDLRASSAQTGAGISVASTVVDYSIGGDDRVIAVGGDWDSFADENGASVLTTSTTLGTLWSYFDNEAISDIWRMVVERVRAEDGTATVPFRCDAPDFRRWFQMTVHSGSDNTVHFHSELLFEEHRAAIDLLALETPRSSEAAPIDVCNWCAKGFDGENWVEIEEIANSLRLLEEDAPAISNGICPSCTTAMLADLLVTGHHEHG